MSSATHTIDSLIHASGATYVSPNTKEFLSQIVSNKTDILTQKVNSIITGGRIGYPIEYFNGQPKQGGRISYPIEYFNGPPKQGGRISYPIEYFNGPPKQGGRISYPIKYFNEPSKQGGAGKPKMFINKDLVLKIIECWESSNNVKLGMKVKHNIYMRVNEHLLESAKKSVKEHEKYKLTKTKFINNFKKN